MKVDSLMAEKEKVRVRVNFNSKHQGSKIKKRNGLGTETTAQVASCSEGARQPGSRFGQGNREFFLQNQVRLVSKLSDWVTVIRKDELRFLSGIRIKLWK